VCSSDLQRLADKISEFGGSWTFIILFLLVLASWMVLNSYYLAAQAEAFDPFPYILLNLVLSTIAALQAPIIMMFAKSPVSKRSARYYRKLQGQLKN